MEIVNVAKIEGNFLFWDILLGTPGSRISKQVLQMCWESKIKVDLSSRKAGRHENIGDINNGLHNKNGSSER